MCQVLSQFNPPLQQLRDRNMSMGIVLIEVIGTSDTLNYKPFLKYCILQTILYFFLLYLCGTISFVQKTELYTTFA